MKNFMLCICCLVLITGCVTATSLSEIKTTYKFVLQESETTTKTTGLAIEINPVLITDASDNDELHGEVGLRPYLGFPMHPDIPLCNFPAFKVTVTNNFKQITSLTLEPKVITLGNDQGETFRQLNRTQLTDQAYEWAKLEEKKKGNEWDTSDLHTTIRKINFIQDMLLIPGAKKTGYLIFDIPDNGTEFADKTDIFIINIYNVPTELDGTGKASKTTTRTYAFKKVAVM